MEGLLNLEIAEVGAFQIMCSPNDLRALAVGFAFSEGMIASREEILLLSQCQSDPFTIRMQLAHPQKAGDGKRNLLVVSSCGMCGSQIRLEEFIARLPRAGAKLRLPIRWVQETPVKLRSLQRLFQTTGGTHAAAVFDPSGELISFGEDVGRHNALDKAIGLCVLSNRGLEGCALVLSGRVSLELVAKSARAGIELIAAFSAPSSLAVATAERCNITLVGFVRDDRATVYSHFWRIQYPPASSPPADPAPLVHRGSH